MRHITLITVTLAGCLPALALAHHGSVENSGLYYSDELVELEGELTEMLWHNPHARARVKVVGEDGEETTWEIEFGQRPREFERMGLLQVDFLGNVKVAGYVSRRKPNAFGSLHFLLPDGREIVAGRRREARWSNVRVAGAEAKPNAAQVRAAEAAADGIFRVWDRRLGRPIETGLRSQIFTEQGKELADAYDPIADNGQLECRHGMPDTMFDPLPMEISDEGDQIRIHVEQYNIQRIVHMNAPDADDEQPASSVGYSVGRWDGDTLVVNTTNVDWPYYSGDGTPQSGEVSYLERFSVSEDGKTLNYSITIDDPAIFTEPFTMERTREAAPGVELEPFNCVVNWEDASA